MKKKIGEIIVLLWQNAELLDLGKCKIVNECSPRFSLPRHG